MIHVACTADANYLPYCAAMLHSLHARSGSHGLTVHYLSPPELEHEVRSRVVPWLNTLGVRAMCHVVPDAAVAGLPGLRGVQRLAWYRLFLDELVPGQPRVLYLDADTLVTDDVQPLWETRLDDHPLAAVRNVTDLAALPHLRNLGMPESAPLFNTGVLLLNLDVMRAERIRDQVLDYARRAAFDFRWADQDALNAVLWQRSLLLHPRWNAQNSLFYWRRARDVLGDTAVDEAVRDPAILHFEGPEIVKPWHYLSRHPYRAQYLMHLRATPWGDLPLQGRTALHRVLRLLPDAVVHRYWGFRHQALPAVRHALQSAWHRALGTRARGDGRRGRP